MDLAKKSKAGQAAGGQEALLHGKAPIDNKASGVDNAPEPGSNEAEEVRKAPVLHYHEGNDVEGQTSKFKSDNAEWVVQNEVDEMYPGAKEY